MTDGSETGRVVGVDFGTVRVGLAISDSQRRIASPLETYTRRDAQQDAHRFRRLVDEERVSRFVVGLPVHGDGRESASSARAVEFGRWLAETTGVPVDYLDERYTTRQAEEMLAQAEVPRSKRKERLDKLAAQILLSVYLERGCRGTDPTTIDPLEDRPARRDRNTPP